MEEMRLGFEPIIYKTRDKDGMVAECGRLRGLGKDAVVLDNGNGTFGLWERTNDFWID